MESVSVLDAVGVCFDLQMFTILFFQFRMIQRKVLTTLQTSANQILVCCGHFSRIKKLQILRKSLFPRILVHMKVLWRHISEPWESHCMVMRKITRRLNFCLLPKFNLNYLKNKISSKFYILVYGNIWNFFDLDLAVLQKGSIKPPLQQEMVKAVIVAILRL